MTRTYSISVVQNAIGIESTNSFVLTMSLSALLGLAQPELIVPIEKSPSVKFIDAATSSTASQFDLIQATLEAQLIAELRELASSLTTNQLPTDLDLEKRLLTNVWDLY